jgi:RimJ/RimL family protein N-acetyltransferase
MALFATARGHSYGSEARRLLAEYLFAHTQVNRIEAETEVGNIAGRRALEKAGFAFEGTVRGSCFPGRPVAGHGLVLDPARGHRSRLVSTILFSAVYPTVPPRLSWV